MPGSKGEWDIQEIARWICQKKRVEIEVPVSPGPGEAPSTPASTPAEQEALERLRTAKAEQEEIKLAEMKREMIRASEIMPHVLQMGFIYRNLAEELEKRFGFDALDLIKVEGPVFMRGHLRWFMLGEE
mgnify:CR=1 FL=1